MTKLTAAEIRSALPSLSGWKRRGAVLGREFEFPDFVTAMKFVQAIGRAAEKAQHHPDIDIRWNRVLLKVTTHDAGGLTALDLALAARANELAAKVIQ